MAGAAGSPPPEPSPTEPSPAALRRWRRRLADERQEAKVYRSLASRRSGDEREILLELADAEERHAAHWTTLLGDDVGPPHRGDIRMRVLAWLARHFGSVFVLALAQRAENRSSYDTDLDATRAMAADERVHEEVVRGLAARGRAKAAVHKIFDLRGDFFGESDEMEHVSYASRFCVSLEKRTLVEREVLVRRSTTGSTDLIPFILRNAGSGRTPNRGRI